MLSVAGHRKSDGWWAFLGWVGQNKSSLYPEGGEIGGGLLHCIPALLTSQICTSYIRPIGQACVLLGVRVNISPLL